MRAVSPSIGFPERIVGENQLQYSPLPVADVEHTDGSRSIVTRWSLTATEREAVARGEDLFIAQPNFGNPMTPLAVMVGAAHYAND